MTSNSALPNGVSESRRNRSKFPDTVCTTYPPDTRPKLWVCPISFTALAFSLTSHAKDAFGSHCGETPQPQYARKTTPGIIEKDNTGAVRK